MPEKYHGKCPQKAFPSREGLKERGGFDCKLETKRKVERHRRQICSKEKEEEEGCAEKGGPFKVANTHLLIGLLADRLASNLARL